MKRPLKDPRPQFSHPVRQLTIMLVVLALCAAGAYFAFPRVAGIFLANIWLNGFIAFVFVVGVLACFWQVLQLSASVSWIEGFAAERPGHEITIAPRLLAPLAALLRGRGARSHISASSARSILDSVGTRIEEERDITRYIINLLIFLGLLGTFYGLAMTVPAVVETIRSLAPTEGEGSLAVFDRLMQGLEAQLAGMGTAFSSSLLGLAGSLVVGLLELFAGHGQNRFYRQLEEWLTSITRLGHVAAEGDSPADANLVVGMLEQTAEQMDALQELVSSTDQSRRQMEEQVAGLTRAVSLLVERIGTEQSDAKHTTQAITRLAEGQERLATALESRGAASDDAATDAETRLRLRSIDVQLVRILEEMAAGREETTAGLRGDLAQLTNAVRQLSRPSASGRGG